MVNNKIIVDGKEVEIPDITDSPIDLYEGMDENQKNRVIYENKFNLVIINIFNHVTQFYKNADITNAQDQMNEVLIQSPDGPICCFLKYVYLNDVYRKELLDMNEQFFLESERIEENPEVAKDKEIIERIFSFKKIWQNFSLETKRFILRALRGLVLISTKYINFME